MAQQTKTSSQIRLVFQKGMNVKGEMMYAAKVISGISVDATAEQLNRIGRLLASLQTLPLDRIERVEKSLIHE